MTTVTRALDHLTDVLAGSDVTLKGTKADCIMQLADMIEDGTIVIGGGGGGGGATKVVFTENDTTDGVNVTYTLTNATAALDALEAVITAEDWMSTSLDYVGACTNLASGSIIFPAYVIVSSGEGDVLIASFASAAEGVGGDRTYVSIFALYDGNDIIFCVEDPEVGAATRADIDPETDTLTIVYPVE